jgi:hypothetical protein
LEHRTEIVQTSVLSWNVCFLDRTETVTQFRNGFRRRLERRGGGGLEASGALAKSPHEEPFKKSFARLSPAPRGGDGLAALAE